MGDLHTNDHFILSLDELDFHYQYKMLWISQEAIIIF